MRKIKKINGFLVVKFNDREKREYEGTALGEYGVIDAELYTFLNNLTGGKLGEVKDKFTSAMSGIAQGVSQKFNDVRTFFSNGLNNVKNLVTNAISWFRDSGKKIVTTFAEGISSTFSSAVNAVKNGLQKIRNMLPFSDAKEGPLSTLTLSGQRTMTTYAEGLIEAKKNEPSE